MSDPVVAYTEQTGAAVDELLRLAGVIERTVQADRPDLVAQGDQLRSKARDLPWVVEHIVVRRAVQAVMFQFVMLAGHDPAMVRDGFREFLQLAERTP